MPRKIRIRKVMATAAALAGLAGLMGGAASANAETKTFTQTQDISIFDLNNFDPKPSTLEVTGMKGTVSKVVLQFQDWSATRPPDIDTLLVAPGNRTVVPISDVGAATPIVDLDIAFDDAAANPPSQGGPVSSGTFKPFDPVDPDEPTGTAFGAPAPPYGHTMAALNGGSPNGQWRLFGFEDVFNGGGQVGGIDDWSVQVTTIEPEITLQARKQKLGGKVTLTATGNVDGQLSLTGGVKGKTVELKANEPTAVNAKVKKSVRKALAAKLDSGATAKVPVTGTFTDASQSVDTASAKVKVK